MVSMDISLSDDELVALAVMKGGRWPSVLPTVEVESGEDLFAASFRGVRSLRCRRLLDEDGVLDGEVATIQSLSNAEAMTVVYPALHNYERAAWTMSSTHFRVGDQWLIDGVDGIGAHEFGIVTTEERREALRALLSSVTVSSRDTSNPWIVVAEIRGGRPVSAVVAGSGGVRSVGLVVGGDGSVVEASSTDISLDQALEMLS